MVAAAARDQARYRVELLDIDSEEDRGGDQCLRAPASGHQVTGATGARK
jgi:hypothetical protein